ncbi:DUF2934 domain-containing protein [uncultured Limimaricola sp.]|uniref:DUF2934 domain-containing protein n=1 Tax=uncultured Limimaricola sp. TaxID=2211667 RepID=UPI0030F7382B
MSTTPEDRIRQRAYELWEREGCPVDRSEAHWRQAAQEINDEDSQTSPVSAKSPIRSRPRRQASEDRRNGPKAHALKAAEAAARQYGLALSDILETLSQEKKKGRRTS